MEPIREEPEPIRRKPVPSTASSGSISTIRRKPVASGQYQQVAAQDEDDDSAQQRSSNVSGSSFPNAWEEQSNLLDRGESGEFRGEPPIPIQSHHLAAYGIPWDAQRSSETIKESRDGSAGSYDGTSAAAWSTRPRPGMWDPIWLSPTVLAGFAVGFLAMLLATGLLYHFSVVNRGISTQIEVNHYAWKYGPTASMNLLLLFWEAVC
jgi:hypothetical protein